MIKTGQHEQNREDIYDSLAKSTIAIRKDRSDEASVCTDAFFTGFEQVINKKGVQIDNMNSTLKNLAARQKTLKLFDDSLRQKLKEFLSRGVGTGIAYAIEKGGDGEALIEESAKKGYNPNKIREISRSSNSSGILQIMKDIGRMTLGKTFKGNKETAEHKKVEKRTAKKTLALFSLLTVLILSPTLSIVRTHADVLQDNTKNEKVFTLNHDLMDPFSVELERLKQSNETISPFDMEIFSEATNQLNLALGEIEDRSIGSNRIKEMVSEIADKVIESRSETSGVFSLETEKPGAVRPAVIQRVFENENDEIKNSLKESLLEIFDLDFGSMSSSHTEQIFRNIGDSEVGSAREAIFDLIEGESKDIVSALADYVGKSMDREAIIGMAWALASRDSQEQGFDTIELMAHRYGGPEVCMDRFVEFLPVCDRFAEQVFDENPRDMDASRKLLEAVIEELPILRDRVENSLTYKIQERFFSDNGRFEGKTTSDKDSEYNPAEIFEIGM